MQFSLFFSNRIVFQDVKAVLKWKKSSRFDSFTAKTRGLKRKFDGNSTNYMEKLLDEIENKRSKRGDKTDENRSER